MLLDEKYSLILAGRKVASRDKKQTKKNHQKSRAKLYETGSSHPIGGAAPAGRVGHHEDHVKDVEAADEAHEGLDHPDLEVVEPAEADQLVHVRVLEGSFYSRKFQSWALTVFFNFFNSKKWKC